MFEETKARKIVLAVTVVLIACGISLASGYAIASTTNTTQCAEMQAWHPPLKTPQCVHKADATFNDYLMKRCICD